MEQKDSNYRCYFINNPYLSSIQQGIQAGHAHGRLLQKYKDTNCEKSNIAWDWNKNYETYIILNGSNSENMKNFLHFLNENDLKYPFSFFEEPFLDNALTSIAIVLPERIYNAKKYFSYHKNKQIFSPLSQKIKERKDYTLKEYPNDTINFYKLDFEDPNDNYLFDKSHNIYKYSLLDTVLINEISQLSLAK